MPDLDDLLIKTSRTFAASIPLLPEPWRRQVGIAYLLFRIADTFEDADRWTPPAKLAALARFDEMLTEAPGPIPPEWVATPPCEHAGYVELLESTPFVLAELAALERQARERIIHYTRRTIAGMAQYVSRTDENNTLRLADLDDLRQYCYYVAGIVGELLTELLLVGQSLGAWKTKAALNQARLFGEGLQLVNILKDSASDARVGRYYLPATIERAKVMTLARESLVSARDYTLAAARAGAPGGVLAFFILPLVLAWATLDRVEKYGSGAKVTRAEVMRLIERINEMTQVEKPKITKKTFEELYGMMNEAWE